jgi:hypothetical protein
MQSQSFFNDHVISKPNLKWKSKVNIRFTRLIVQGNMHTHMHTHNAFLYTKVLEMASRHFSLTKNKLWVLKEHSRKENEEKAM